MADNECPDRRLPQNQGSRLVSLYAATSVAYGCPARQTCQRIGSPVEHCNGDHGKETLPVFPQVDPGKVVSSHEPGESTEWNPALEAGDGINREVCSKIGLESGHRDPCALRKGPGPRQPFGKGQHAVDGFQGIVRRHQPPDFIEAQLTAGDMTDKEMPLVSGIE